MSKSRTIVHQIMVTETHIVHHNGYYMRSRTQNGFAVDVPHVIPMQQAQKIVEQGEADPRTTTSSRFGTVTFPGTETWSWIGLTTMEVVH